MSILLYGSECWTLSLEMKQLLDTISVDLQKVIENSMDRANNKRGSLNCNKKDTYNQDETAKIPSRHNKEEKFVNVNPQRPY